MFGSFGGLRLLFMAGVVLVPIAIVVLVIGLVVRRARADGSSPVVSVTLWLATVWAALSLAGGVIALLNTLLSPQVTLTVPVQQYWPLPAPGISVSPTSDTVVGGGFTSAELTIDGLSTAARWLWGLGTMTGILVPAAVAGLIALMCFQLLRGAAFAPVVARGTTITAVVVTVGGLASQLLCGIAGSMASSQALGLEFGTAEGYPDDFDLATFVPQSALSLDLNFWPIGAGLALAALAAVFAYGAKLQRETELLV